jgi:hypothetical protein
VQETVGCENVGELGRYPLKVVYFTKCIKYWLQILDMPDERYPRRCDSMLLHLHEAGRKTWATHVKALLYMHGFQYVWIYQGVADVRCFVNIFTQRVKDTWVQVWHDSVSGYSKLKCYNDVKCLLEPEKYLSCVTHRQLGN